MGSLRIIGWRSRAKGALRVELYAAGKMAHSAYPELGESAIDRLVAVLADLQKLANCRWWKEIGDTTLNVGIISGGTCAECNCG